jgi:hypothetical protein
MPRDEARRYGTLPRLRCILGVLLEARVRAEQVGHDPWDFAEEIHSLREAGGLGSDLRWLITQGYAECKTDVTTAGDERRRFRPGGPMALTARTCFVLTMEGECYARKLEHAESASGTQPEGVSKVGARGIRIPRWDCELRQLWFSGSLIREYRVPSPNQELILAAFQELMWPAHIDDPLPPVPGVETRKRLHDTIVRLNRHHQHRRIRFRGNGGGRVYSGSASGSRLERLATPGRHRTGTRTAGDAGRGIEKLGNGMVECGKGLATGNTVVRRTAQQLTQEAHQVSGG